MTMILRTFANVSAVLMIAGLSGTITVVTQEAEPIAPPDRSIVFVCEHGAALSVIATTLFNKLAAGRGLPQRAIYRGVNPQSDLSVATLKGLREDGLLPPTDKPAPITAADVAAATYIFAIGCALPQTAAASGKTEDWSDVPLVSDGYAAARDAIRRHVEHLIDQLHAPGGVPVEQRADRRVPTRFRSPYPRNRWAGACGLGAHQYTVSDT